MKKKIMAIALIMLFVTSVFAFADAVFSGKDTNTLTVRNSNNKSAISGQVCVTFEKADKSRATVDVNYEVSKGGSRTYSIPGKILFWSETFCYVLSE